MHVMQDADENMTPAELAAGNGHVRIVERILESSSAQSEKKMTALHLATQGNFEQLVGQLLALPDISPNVADADGLTPLHWAATKGRVPSVVCKVALCVEIFTRASNAVFQFPMLRSSLALAAPHLMAVWCDRLASCCRAVACRWR